MSSAVCFNLDQSQILSSGNGLILNQAISSYPGLRDEYFIKKKNME